MSDCLHSLLQRLLTCILGRNLHNYVNLCRLLIVGTLNPWTHLRCKASGENLSVLNDMYVVRVLEI